MDIPYEVDSLDKVEEAYRGLYKKDDAAGVYRAGLAGLPKVPDAKDFEALKAKAEQLDKFKGVTDEDLKTLEEARAGKLIKQGKLFEYTEAKLAEAAQQYKSKMDGYETQLSEANGLVKSYEAQIRERAEKDLMDKHLSELKYEPKNLNARQMAQTLLLQNWSVNDKGQLEGKNADGTPLLSKEKPGQRMEIGEAIRAVVTENPFLFAGSDGKDIKINGPGTAHGLDLSDPAVLGKFALSTTAGSKT